MLKYKLIPIVPTGTAIATTQMEYTIHLSLSITIATTNKDIPWTGHAYIYT